MQCTNCKSILRADEVIEAQVDVNVGEHSTESMSAFFTEKTIDCPVCGSVFEDVELRPFNIMFNLDIGPTGKGEGFLRPETAQNMFLNFRYTKMGVKENLPFAIVQTGKAFRNEISPRQFLYRLREFNQMEIEIFGTPEIFAQHPALDRGLEITFLPKNEEKAFRSSLGALLTEEIFPNEYFAYLVGKAATFYRRLGIPEEDLRFKEIPDEDRPFYSAINVDVEIHFSIGWKEVEGTAYRTDWDLKRHSEVSGEDLDVLYNGERVIPHVVEASFGVDRSVMAILEKAFHRKEEDRKWKWLELPPCLSPFSVAVFPLFDREELITKAREIFEDLTSNEIDAIYKEKGSIGKRYRFADEVGIPYCITVDPTTLEENSATIRDIMTKRQIRPSCEKFPSILSKLLKGKATFKDYAEGT